jgi:transcriptional regulator with XRE-family HTH domain
MTDETLVSTTPWGQLIRQGRQARNLSIPKAASQAGINVATWGNIERGYQSTGPGKTIPAPGLDRSVAQMAFVAGVSPERLEVSGRADASAVLREIIAQVEEADATAPMRYADPALQRIADDPDLTDMEKRGAITAVQELRQADSTPRRHPA